MNEAKKDCVRHLLVELRSFGIGGGGGSLISHLSICYCLIFLIKIYRMPPNMPPIDIAGAL